MLLKRQRRLVELRSKQQAKLCAPSVALCCSGASFVLVQYSQFTHPGDALHVGVLSLAFFK